MEETQHAIVPFYLVPVSDNVIHPIDIVNV